MNPQVPATSVESEQDSHLVETWFGAGFESLHPMLQALHRRGGILSGELDVRFGRGLSGWLGRRLARKVGIPAQAGWHALQVRIRHDDRVLHWDRCFGGKSWMLSQFEPVGMAPDGYWVERTGPIALRLTVDIVEGGWHWRVLGARLHGVPIPLGLVLRSRAYKQIESGRYRFHVGLSAPWLGEILSYGGLLEAVPGV